MSGRPYARNPRAPYAGPRDLEAVLPHTFRIEAPRRLRDAKSEAIRSAIRRRCMQKNWRKLISIRHNRLNGEKEEKQEERDEKEQEEAPPQESAAELAKKQLQELEQKLQALTDQKHAKFQLLKDILVEEARSKMTGATKKRRVEFKESMTPSPAKLQSEESAASPAVGGNQ